MFDLTNKTILVAGGAGYLGSQLCEAILLHNGNICIADINVEKINSLKDKGAGFGHETNKVTVLSKNGEKEAFSLKSKKEVAEDIIEIIYNSTIKH